MKKGKRYTMRNISCSILFSSTFRVISRKFWLLFGQCAETYIWLPGMLSCLPVCPYVSLLYSLYILSQILFYLNLWKPTELNVTDGADATSYFLFCAHANCACLAHKPDIARCIHSISDGSVFVCKASDHFWDSAWFAGWCFPKPQLNNHAPPAILSFLQYILLENPLQKSSLILSHGQQSSSGLAIVGMEAQPCLCRLNQSYFFAQVE